MVIVVWPGEPYSETWSETDCFHWHHVHFSETGSENEFPRSGDPGKQKAYKKQYIYIYMYNDTYNIQYAININNPICTVILIC